MSSPFSPDVPALPDDWCYSHSRSEPIPEGGAYQVCGECFHCWPTREDFVRDVRLMYHEINGVDLVTLDADQWPFCPLCAHDF